VGSTTGEELEVNMGCMGFDPSDVKSPERVAFEKWWWNTLPSENEKNSKYICRQAWNAALVYERSRLLSEISKELEGG
jgi:hypothetical protein